MSDGQITLLTAIAGDESTTAQEADELVRQFAKCWTRGDRPDAVEWVAAHEPLRLHRSFALDVAYEEFCQRTAGGEQLDTAAFCRQFPEFRSSLYRLLSAHRLLIDSRQPGETALHWPQVGDQLLGLRLLDVLGRGAFARVFLAAEPALNRRVAVKFARFGAAEAEILGSLDHPRVVPVHYVRVDPASGLSAIVMPYRSRVTLAEVIDRLSLSPRRPDGGQFLRKAADARPDAVGEDQRQRLPAGSFVDEAANIGAALAGALSYTHRRGICHCDLKPSNILLDETGQPLLIDFNLSVIGQNAPERLGGTLPYMAPEQIRAVFLDRSSSATPDPRSDLFSLGVVLHELLTGAHPFDADALAAESTSTRDFAERLLARQQRTVTRLDQVDPRIDPSLATLVARCLTHDVDQRPPSADALLAEFQRRDRRGPRLRRLARRRRKTFAAGLAGFIAVVLTVAAWSVTREPWPRREFQLGAAALSTQRFDEAIDHFRHSLDANPGQLDAHLGLALTYQRKGDYHWAMREYLLAREKHDDPRLLMGAAYCAAQDNDSGRASDLLADLVDEGGYVSAEIFADRGYCLWQAGRIPDARTWWDQALQLDDRLQAVYYDRALCEFKESFREARNVAPQALADIRRAVEIGPDAADLHLDAARIICRSGSWDQDKRAAALQQIEQAVRIGADPSGLAKDPFWPQLHDDPDLARLVSGPPPSAQPTRPLRIYDPLRNERLK